MDVLRLPNQGDGAAFDALTTKNMAAFNEKVTDDPNVKYYSYGAAFEPSYVRPSPLVPILSLPP
jgi:triacylglycerol lipase